MTYRTPMLQPASLLCDTQKIKRLAPLEGRLPVQLVLSQGRGTLHEGLRGPHGTSVPLDQCRRQPCRDAEDTEQEEHADRPVLGPQPLRKQLLRDEAKLKVVACKLIQGLQDFG